jgi:hypothetical protein
MLPCPLTAKKVPACQGTTSAIAKTRSAST